MALKIVDLAMRSLGMRTVALSTWTSLSSRLVQNYHRFMIVTANSEDVTVEWVYWTLTDVLIGKLVG